MIPCRARPTSGTRVARALVRCALSVSALVATFASVVDAQDIPAELTLEDALRLARQHNPVFLQAANDIEAANWDVRAAYGQWVPSASASSGFSWQGSGEQRFGSLTLGQLGFTNQPSYYFSNYGVGASMNLSGTTLMAPGQAKARRNATEADIRAAEAQLELGVTQAYLQVLLNRENLVLSQQELARAEFNLRLAEGQLEVGSATRLDVTQAEVAVGRAQVSLLQAETGLHTAKIRLAQQLGLDPSADYAASSTFALETPTLTEAELFELAIDQNPALAALRANERSADYGVRMARSAYYPSLTLNANLKSGFTRQASNADFLVESARRSATGQVQQCEALNELFVRLADPLPRADCSQFNLSPADEQAIVDRNSQFPFDFEGSPPTFGLTFSIPIFQGLSRQRDVETARVQREDMRYQVREQELRLSGDIAAGLAAVRTAYEGARIEERNQDAAEEQLRLASEQYRLGLVSFLQLVEAETVKAQADRELLSAIFTYHDNLASLEATIGAPLRTR